MNCIVNVSENWGIGCDGALLVSISADLKRFRELTSGKTVILGRKTLATFPGGRPLKNRRNLILSTNPDFTVEGAEVVHSVPELLCAVHDCADDAVCVIGGAEIYKLLLPYCHKAQITKTFVHQAADAFFPNLDELEGWQVESAGPVEEENGIRYQYIDYINLNSKAY